MVKLRFFPLDTDILRQTEVRRVLRKKGPLAVSVLLSVLTKVYGEYGYFLPIDDVTAEDILDDTYDDSDSATIMGVIEMFVESGVFDKEKYNDYKIITSREIQQRYIYSMTHTYKKRADIKNEYSCITEDKTKTKEQENAGELSGSTGKTSGVVGKTSGDFGDSSESTGESSDKHKQNINKTETRQDETETKPKRNETTGVPSLEKRDHFPVVNESKTEDNPIVEVVGNVQSNGQKTFFPIPKKEESVDYTGICDQFIVILGDVFPIPNSKNLNETRKQHIRNRNDDLKRLGMTWKEYFTKVKESDFLCGRSPQNKWKASFDWIILPTNFVKIVEGNYNNRGRVNLGQQYTGMSIEEEIEQIQKGTR